MVSVKYLPLTSRGGSTPIPQGKCGYLKVGVKCVTKDRRVLKGLYNWSQNL